MDQQTHTDAPPKPDNYLVWSILATLCCCLPFGIPAIVFASQVDGKHASGDYQGAQESSDKAKMWTMIAAGLGLVGGILYGVMMAMGMAAGASGY